MQKKTSLENIRIYHECEGGLDKYIQKITVVWQCDEW